MSPVSTYHLLSLYLLALGALVTLEVIGDKPGNRTFELSWEWSIFWKQGGGLLWSSR